MNPYYDEGKELLRKITDWYIFTKSSENELWRMDILDDLNKISVDQVVSPKKQNKKKTETKDEDNVPDTVESSI